MAQCIEENKVTILQVKNVEGFSDAETHLYKSLSNVQLKSAFCVPHSFYLDSEQNNMFEFLYQRLYELREFVCEFQVCNQGLYLSFVHCDRFFICGKVKIEFLVNNRIEFNVSRINTEIALCFFFSVKNNKVTFPSELVVDYSHCDLSRIIRLTDASFLLAKDAKRKEFISFFRVEKNFKILTTLFRREASLKVKGEMIYIIYTLLQNCPLEFVEIAGCGIDGFAIAISDDIFRYILDKYVEIEIMLC